MQDRGSGGSGSRPAEASGGEGVEGPGPADGALITESGRQGTSPFTQDRGFASPGPRAGGGGPDRDKDATKELERSAPMCLVPPPGALQEQGSRNFRSIIPRVQASQKWGEVVPFRAR